MKIVVCGNYGARNIGDEMILEGLLKVLPKEKITVLSANPEETAEKYEVESVHKFPSGFRSFLQAIGYKKTKEAVGRCDYFVLGGGGLFGGPEVRGNLVWYAQARMAYKYNKPVLILGQSIAQPRGFFEKIIMKKIFSRAAFIQVRDQASKDIIKSLGISQKVHVVPDMAFALQFDNYKSDKTMLVALRQTKLSRRFKKNIASFLEGLKKEGWRFEFVNFQEGQNGDRNLHEQIAKMAQIETKYINHPSKSEASVVLAMRLHSIISAIIMDKSFIALNYSPKVRNFLEYAKLDSALVELKNATPENLIAKLSQRPQENAKTFYHEARKQLSALKKELHEFLTNNDNSTSPQSPSS